MIDFLYQVGNAVCRIQTLIGIHLPSHVGVPRHLPPAYINGLKPGHHLLNRLFAVIAPRAAT